MERSLWPSPPEIAQFLVQLKKQFTSYQLSKAAALRSIYSWRLFENLERFRDTGIWEVDADRFHLIMETPKSYHENFAQTRRFVIDPALAELAAKTNITAEVEPIRRGARSPGCVSPSRAPARSTFHLNHPPPERVPTARCDASGLRSGLSLKTCLWPSDFSTGPAGVPACLL